MQVVNFPSKRFLVVVLGGRGPPLYESEDAFRFWRIAATDVEFRARTGFGNLVGL